MNKIFLDTNIWIRPLVEDSKQSTEIINLIKAVDQGQFQPYTSNIVLLEVNFVLQSVYKAKSSSVITDIQNILKTKSLVLIEKTRFKEAIKLHQQTRVKLTDCLIATQLPPNTTLITYDQDFQKLPGVTSKTPKQLLT
jgi:predicted nucleic-acid-binding protein